MMSQQQKLKLRSMNPDRQIDQLVYELYELTAKEIAIAVYEGWKDVKK